MVEWSSEAQDFQTLFVQAVETGLKEMVGDSGTKAIIYHIQSPFPDIENILTEPEKLDEGLRKFFGVGAKTLERRILAHLQTITDTRIEMKVDIDFCALVKQVEREYSQRIH